MKRFSLTIIFAAMALLSWGGTADAAVYQYDDLFTEWIGFATPEHANDVVGNPDLLGVQVTTSDTGYLQTIEVSFDPSFGFGMTNIGDYNSLFIQGQWDIGSESWQNWDYYLRLENERYNPLLGGDVFDSDNYNASFYDVTAVSTTYTTPDPLIPAQRFDHPNGIDTSALTADPTFLTSFDLTNTDPLSIVYTFENDKIRLGDNFVIGYTEWCANDNFITPNTIPEPATLTLLATGLLGLAAAGRRRHKTTGR